ncbi:MAG: hypothetical protein ACJAVI_005535 [Candidatus Azotimanducaceae bacterium]|jgi:hypothetical protein
MFDHAVTGSAAPAHPCARGIRKFLHIIDVRLFNLEDGQDLAPTDSNKEFAA